MNLRDQVGLLTTRSTLRKKMKNKTTPSGRGTAAASQSLKYQLIRNVTSEEEKRYGVQTHIANFTAREILKLGTEANLRDYIGASSKVRRSGTHFAIEETIKNDPDRFINRNSGFTIACKAIKIDDSKKTAELFAGSIINGAQTQGEIRRYLEKCDNGEEDEATFTVRAEIIVDPDSTSITETAIARNTATAVKAESQANARKYLDDLAENVAKMLPEETLRRTETDDGNLDPLELVQLARLLMPTEVIGELSNSELLKPYCGKAKCFTDFNSWAELVVNKRKDNPGYENAKVKYDFTVSMAPVAYQLLESFRHHESWKGQNLRSETKVGGKLIERGKNRSVKILKNGLLFPLISAFRVFVKRDQNGNWQVKEPKIFSKSELVKSAATQLRLNGLNPMDMGRNLSSYGALLEHTRIMVLAMESVDNL